MIVGMATVAIWLFFDIGVIYELIPGFVFSGIAIILVSLLTEEPPEEVKQEFQDATGATGLRVEPSDEVGAPGDDWGVLPPSSTYVFPLIRKPRPASPRQSPLKAGRTTSQHSPPLRGVRG